MKRVMSFLLVLLMLVGLVPMQSAAFSDLYNVWAYDGDYQYVTVSHTEAYAGETVTVTPIAGYYIDYMEVYPSDSDPLPLFGSASGYSFIMPEGNVDIMVLVKSADGTSAPHGIWLLSAGGGDPVADKTAAAAGETVTITPNPEAGNVFQKIQVDYYSTTGHNEIYELTVPSFVMPDDVRPGQDVKVVVYYQRDPNAPPSNEPLNIESYAGEGGTISIPATAMPGETVTVIVNADEGFVPDVIYCQGMATGEDCTTTKVSETQYTFVMPNEDVQFVITFKEGVDEGGDEGGNEEPLPTEYDITVTAPQNGTLTTSAAKAKKDEVITITATPAEGFLVDQITVIDSNGNPIAVTGNQFVMPEGPVTIAVSFVREEPEVTGLTFNYAYDVYRSPAYPKKGSTIRLYNFSKPLSATGGRVDNAATWTLINVGKYSSFKNTASANSTLKNITSGVASNYNVSADNLSIYQLTRNGEHITYGVLLMQDIGEQIALFIGSNYSGTGAGYVFANTQQSGSKDIEVKNDVTDDAEPEAPSITVTFDGNGGTASVSSAKVNAQSKLDTLPTANREGYIFAGWSTEDGTPVTKETVFTQNAVVYARWVAHTTAPSENAYSADIALDDQAIVDMLITDDDMQSGQDVRIFMEVEEQSEEAVPNANKTAIAAKAGTDTIAAYLDIQLFKQIGNAARQPITNTQDNWIPITLQLTGDVIPANAAKDSFYIIYYHVEGGIATTGVIPADYNVATKTLSFRANKFSTYALAYTTYEVKFEANGGTGTMKTLRVPAGSFTLPTNGFKAPSGKTFDSWKVGNTTKKPGDTITISADTTVTAVWKTSSGQKDDVPKTGDISFISTGILLVLCSTAMLAGSVVYEKKRAR